MFCYFCISVFMPELEYHLSASDLYLLHQKYLPPNYDSSRNPIFRTSLPPSTSTPVHKCTAARFSPLKCHTPRTNGPNNPDGRRVQEEQEEEGTHCVNNPRVTLTAAFLAASCCIHHRHRYSWKEQEHLWTFRRTCLFADTGQMKGPGSVLI